MLISGVRSEILLLLIEYAYLRRIEVSDSNVHELLMTADYLAFLGVLQLCCDHLRASLSPKNCLGIMMFARSVLYRHTNVDFPLITWTLLRLFTWKAVPRMTVYFYTIPHNM